MVNEAKSKFFYILDTDQPVNAENFGNALSAVGKSYSEFLVNHEKLESVAKKDKLQISEVRTGSLLAEFVSVAAPVALPLMSEKYTLLNYYEYLKVSIDFLKGAVEKFPMTKKSELEPLTDMLKVVSESNGVKKIKCRYEDKERKLDFSISKFEADPLLKAIEEEKAKLTKTYIEIFNNQPLKWHQVNLGKKKKGDRATILKFSDKPARVAFENSKIKDKMMKYRSDVNWHDCVFMVDGEAHIEDSKPIVYKISKLGEILE